MGVRSFQKEGSRMAKARCWVKVPIVSLWNKEIKMICRSQRMGGESRARFVHKVAKICRRWNLLCFGDHKQNFEFNTRGNRKPV